MPKIIFTSRYIKNPAKVNAGKLIRYMGTREGVEKLLNGIDNKPPTQKQRDLICECITAVPEALMYPELKMYQEQETRYTATEFLDAFIERNADRIDGVKKLVKYYGERPGVEKLGRHGLFSQTDDKIDIDKVADEVSNHEGILWTHVISLRREDVEGLGYNNADAWKELVRRNALQIAEAHKIEPSQLKWYGAFHNTTHHPHIHLMVYSKDTKQGYLTNKGIENMRGVFAKDIFRNEMYYAFTLETQMRDEVRAEAKKRIDELLRGAETPTSASEEIQNLYAKLISQLSDCKGKKMYGYLPKNVKETVDSIVAELAKDERIAELYSEWNKANREKLCWLLEQPNVQLILGNHEAMLLSCAFVFDEITEDSIAAMTEGKIELLNNYMLNGGDVTLKALRKLKKNSPDTVLDILDYLRDSLLYEAVTAGERDFLLVHSGIDHFDKNKKLSQYSADDFIWAWPSLDDEYFEDILTVFGHTPTMSFGEAHTGKILKTKTWIDIDVGTGFGQDPVLLRLDDFSEFKL